MRAAACQGFTIRERPDHQPLGPCLHCGKTYQQHRATDPVNSSDEAGKAEQPASKYSKFDFDPEALEWARNRVEQVRDKWRKFEKDAAAKGDNEAMMRARRVANLMQMELIGGSGCVITAFDWRLPTMLEALGEKPLTGGGSDD